jgi:hypothetical protein
MSCKTGTIGVICRKNAAKLFTDLTKWAVGWPWRNCPRFASRSKSIESLIHQVRQFPQERRSGPGAGRTAHGEYADERKSLARTSQLVAQNILRIDYSKLAMAEQGDAADPEA